MNIIFVYIIRTKNKKIEELNIINTKNFNNKKTFYIFNTEKKKKGIYKIKKICYKINIKQIYSKKFIQNSKKNPELIKYEGGENVLK